MFTGMGIVSGISSGARGLIPKSTGGRIGLAAGVTAGGIYGGVQHNRLRNMDKMNDGRGPSASQLSKMNTSAFRGNPFANTGM